MKKLLLLYVITSMAYIANAQNVILVDSIVGLTSPLKVAHAGDNSHRLFVVEKGGAIKVFDKMKNPLGTFITLNPDSIRAGVNSEEGLLSMAFHPQFRNNGFFFIYYVNAAGNIVLDRYSVNSPYTSNTANATTKLNIITIPHPYSNHNGGDIHFGRDGYLYISTGDGGDAGDPNENALNFNSKLGKLLRLNVDVPLPNTSPYIIPNGNLVNNSFQLTEAYCLGLRNPFRWNFDRYNGDFYLGDVGQGAREEIDFIPAGQLGQKNFGWDCREGNIAYPGSDPTTIDCNVPFTPPVYDYAIGGSERSIIGGAVYRGYKYPDLQGWYLAIDYFSRMLRKFDRRQGTASWTMVPQSAFPATTITSFSESEDGELYITARNSGKVYQLGTATNVKTVHVFSGDGNWSDVANWKNGLPTGLNGNHVVVIKPMNGGSCTLDMDATLPSSAQFITEPGSRFTINNNFRLWLKAN